MIVPGFAPRHARTVSSCASASVKSQLSPNNATPRNGRVVSTLLIFRFSRCVLDWGVRSGLIATIFLSMTRCTTDFVGWDSGTIQVKRKRPERNKTPSLVLSIPPCVSARVQGLQSAPQGVAQCNRPTGGVPPGPRKLSCPCTFKGTGSRPPQPKKMIASTPSKLPRSKRTSHPSRLSPDVVVHVGHSQWRNLLWRGLHHHASVSVWTKRAFDLDRSLPC